MDENPYRASHLYVGGKKSRWLLVAVAGLTFVGWHAGWIAGAILTANDPRYQKFACANNFDDYAVAGAMTGFFVGLATAWVVSRALRKRQAKVSFN